MDMIEKDQNNKEAKIQPLLQHYGQRTGVLMNPCCIRMFFIKSKKYTSAEIDRLLNGLMFNRLISWTKSFRMTDSVTGFQMVRVNIIEIKCCIKDDFPSQPSTTTSSHSHLSDNKPI